MKQQITSLVIISLTLISLAGAYWKVPLKATDVFYTPAQSDKNVLDDSIYVKSVVYGSEKDDVHMQTIFDTTNRYNWVITVDCPRDDAICFDEQTKKLPSKYECQLPTCKKNTTAAVPKIDQIMGGRVVFEKNLPSIDNAHFIEGDTRKSLTNTQFYYPTVINTNSDKNILEKYVRAGFGLGATDKNYNTFNFLDKVKDNVKIEKNQFSFYLHKDFPHILFGESQKYFTSQPFTVFKNRAKTNSLSELDISAQYPAQTPPNQLDPLPPIAAVNQWSLSISKITLNKPSTDVAFNPIKPTNNLVNPTAIFDSTTEYIWGDDTIIDNIVQIIGNNMKEKCTPIPTRGQYDCECYKDSTNFPTIYFTFETSKQEFALTGKDYTHIYNDNYVSGTKNCYLLFRKNFFHGPDTTPAPVAGQPAPTPATKLPTTKNILYFGNAFLRSHYVVFNQDDQTISIAKSFNVVTQPKQISSTTQYLAIFVGLLVGLAALVGILMLLPKVSYTQQTIMPPFASQKKSVQTPPRVQNFILQSYVPQNQVVQVQNSPIRTSYARPYQTYIQGQNM